MASKIEIIGGKPHEFEMFVDGVKITQPIISVEWKQSAKDMLPILTISMYADDAVEISGPCEIEIHTRELE